MAKGMGSIRNRQAQGPFKTSGTEMWPAKMCQWIATWLLSVWASSAATASADVPDTHVERGQGGHPRDGRWFLPNMSAGRREDPGWFWAAESLWRGPLLSWKVAPREEEPGGQRLLVVATSKALRESC